MAIVRNFVLDLAFILPMSSSSVPSVFFWLVAVHIVVVLRHFSSFFAVSEIKLFGDGLRQLDRIVGWCVAVAAKYIWNAITFTNMIHNAIDSVFSVLTSKFFCSSLFSAFVYFVVSFANWLVRPIKHLSIREFHRWHKHRSVDRNSTSNSLFINPYFRRQYFDYPEPSCLGASVCCATQSPSVLRQM